ncbi:AAA family ATPase [Lentzea tibetensis]|uniref:AAA family ATPase n=1 Tax=Lentzea tibetensis TaxID=2591470 RepID=A0A563ENW2_9PSEU|nr:helix-turn-helix transcriptional regulator [Lentzea tibetensis]TWP48992.1 AAA family ATPase [Lentzea tibetensis]
MSTGWPFIGREDELRAVLESLSGSGAALVGPAGVGKSRLAAEVVARLERAGHVVSRCYATVATSTIPFGAFATLLPPDLPSANPLGRAVEHLRANGNPVLAVDDAHLLDDASVALLQHLVLHGHSKVLLTARPEAPGVHDLVPRFDIGDLSRRESDELLAQALGHVTSHTTELLWSCTAGNPLYLKELVSSGRAVGTLSSHDGIWAWRGPIDVAGRLAEVVRANLGRLSVAGRDAMELVAHSEPIELAVLAELADAAVLDDLESRGLLRVESSIRRTVVRLGHPLYGSLLRANCPTLRAAAHQRALADRLEATGARRREDLMRIATWRLNSNTPTSASLLAAAATQAWMARDASLAKRLCHAAIEAGGAVQVGPVYAQVLMYAREPEQAEEMLASVMATATDPVDRALLGEIRASNLFYGLARASDAAAMFASVDVPELPPEMRAMLRAGLVTQEAQYLNSAEIALRNDALPDGVHKRQTRALCQLHVGDYAGLLATLDSYEADAAARAAMYPVMQHASQLMRCFALMCSGSFPAAEELAWTVHTELLRDSRWAITETSIYAVLAHCARMRGDTDTALRFAREGAGVRDFGAYPLIFDAMVLGELARVAAVRGALDEARTALARAASACRPAWVAVGLSWEVANAHVLAASGDLTAAASAALRAADAMAGHGMRSSEAAALHDAARFGMDTSARLDALAATMPDPLTQTFALHARAVAAGNPDEFESASESFAAMGATLWAAESLASAARLHRRTGRLRQASQLGARQALLMRDFGVVHTPALAGNQLAQLTDRQVEVARMAAAGLTNQQIADKLHTSRRTVENHLYAVYATLGVTGRDALRTTLNL